MKKFLRLLASAAFLFALAFFLFKGDGPVNIVLSDDGVTVNGKLAPASGRVFVSDDIIYYEEGKGGDYGEGGPGEEHSRREAAEHTVVNITRPGVYVISGRLSKGQIAVNLGENAEKDSNRKVTLLLDGADITCLVGPAIVCYSAYECSPADSGFSGASPDLSGAGFVIETASGSENYLNGSHVAKIYRPGTEKKLHKYDAALESLVSMRLEGEGLLSIAADKEGIESRMHLEINGGDIKIESRDDAINAREDYVSVITLNGGNVFADSSHGEEGDGVDSNGAIVINGGALTALANSESRDSGLDSDTGCFINGGDVVGCGNMYDEISDESRAGFVCLSFAGKVKAGQRIVFRDTDGLEVKSFSAVTDFSLLVLSDRDSLVPGDYSLFLRDVEGNEQKLGYLSREKPGGPGRPSGEAGQDEPRIKDIPGGRNPPEDRPPRGENPLDGETPPRDESPTDGKAPPDGEILPGRPFQDNRGEISPRPGAGDGRYTDIFSIKDGGNFFSGIGVL